MASALVAAAILAACGGGDDQPQNAATSEQDRGSVTTAAEKTTSGSTDVCSRVPGPRVATVIGLAVNVVTPTHTEEGPGRTVDLCVYRTTEGTTATGSVASIETRRFDSVAAADTDFSQTYGAWKPSSGFGDRTATLHTSLDQIAAQFGSVHLTVEVSNLNRDPARYAIAEELMRVASEALEL